MQSMDSYYRDSSLKGPWKIVAPAGQPVVISGGWFQYATTSTNTTFGTKTISPGRGCSAENKLVVGERGKQYLVHLRKSPDGSGCAMDITSLDGSVVEAEAYPRCRIR